ncbi:MAG: S8 family serine peptidase [Opitutales bacterium]|nr:S8 family serine peptidase [Opitutales bacterium]
MTKLSFMFNRMLIGFSLLLFVLLGFKVWDSFTKESSEFVQTLNLEEVTEPPEQIVPLSKPTTFLNEEMPFPVEAERALDLEMLVDSPILEDLTLGFATTQSMQTFLAQAESNGFRVRDHSSELRTVRLRVSDLDKASRYFDKTENEEVPHYNYRVRAPELPRAEFLEGEKSFGANADQWIGIPEERNEWGRGVKVAILDSGIDLSHSNLDGVSIEEIDLVGGGSRSRGHGTAIASIISGNDTGIMGIAPSASLLSIRVLDGEGQGDSFTVAKGIVEAANRGAQVINLSLGGTGESIVLKNAVDYARAQGSLVVAAVGNEGVSGVSYPAKFDHVIGVTSVDANGRQSSFANYGEGVDIAAPGVGVFAAWEDEALVSFSGTSSATAFISGALASEISRNPNLSNDQVVDLLYKYSNESEKPGFDKFTGNGILNVGRIENRNIPNLHDGAIVGYYFDPQEMEGGTTPFLVSIQNQGTAWLNNISLEVEYRGVVKNYIFNNLNPGETRSEKLFLDGSGEPGKGVRISSQLRLGGQTDINPDNNTRVSTISLPD